MRCHVSASVYRQVLKVILTLTVSVPVLMIFVAYIFSMHSVTDGIVTADICSGWHVLAAVFGVESPWPL